jgi:hypothetical protein
LVPVTVYVRATVSDDLRTIHGTFEVEEYAGLQWVDLLSRLPVPTSDRIQQRTFTNTAEEGFVRVESPRPTDRPPSFHTVVPRRMGASGLVPGHGLYLNGLWHPHPIMDGRAALVLWDVVLKLPSGSVGVLNGKVGANAIRWQGTADRLSLAVVPNGRIQVHDIGPLTKVHIVEQGWPRPLRNLRLKAIAMTGIDNGLAQSFVVVETPSRRRLIRNGPHMVFLSDRAFRMSGRQWKNHVPAVRRGLQTASMDVWDPWIRELIGGLTPQTKYEVDSLWEELRWRSFLPRVDALLYDGRSAFMSEVFEETWPSDSLRDDALEIVDNPTPALSAARKLERLYGEESMRIWATAVIAGAHPDEALTVAELPSTALAEWHSFPDPQDISVSVSQQDDGWAIRVHREAHSSAPQEPIPFRINGEDRIWTTESGEDSLEIIHSQRPKKVQVDPQKEVLQDDRSNDTWPKPSTLTVAGSFSEINADQFRPTAALYLVGRRPYASRWVHGLIANTSPIERAGLGYSLGYGFGRLLDRRNRVWQAWTAPSAAWLDPNFDPSEPRGTAIDWTSGIRRDTRDTWPMARRGHRLSAYGGGGLILNQTTNWYATGYSASTLFPLGPAVVSASRAKVDFTTATFSHRKMGLGGGSAVQGLASDHFRGQQRAVASTEIRYAPIRNASIPLWLLWVTHVQLSGSIDAGWVDGRAATGWTGGIAFAADMFGRQPSMLGLWAAAPLWAHKTAPIDDAPTQFYLRATQSY